MQSADLLIRRGQSPDRLRGDPNSPRPAPNSIDQSGKSQPNRFGLGTKRTKIAINSNSCAASMQQRQPDSLGDDWFGIPNAPNHSQVEIRCHSTNRRRILSRILRRSSGSQGSASSCDGREDDTVAMGTPRFGRERPAMNWNQLGLTRRPFRPAPSLEFYVPLPSRETAIAELRAAYDGGSGIALIIGQPGIGKTLLGLRFLESLGSDILPVFIPSSRFSTAADLHRSILFDLGRDYRGSPEHELRLSLVDLFLKSLADRKRIVLVLDEAQHLPDDVLEEIRLLDNWDARGTKAVFTILIGQPVLNERMNRQEWDGLRGRITGPIRLGPLSDAEAGAYIRGQLESCCHRVDDLIADEVIEAIIPHAQGIPRNLNRLMTILLDASAAARVEAVELEIALEAIEALMGEIPDATQSAQSAHSVLTAKSGNRRTRNATEAHDSATAHPPKQKTRKRPAA
jgi:MSHA biogenesis protein MshM